MEKRDDVTLGLLPDLFTLNSGEVVKNPEDWLARRKEILNTAVEIEFGGMPPEPEFTRLEATHQPGKRKLNSYRVHTGKKENPFSFILQIFRPDTDGRLPVILTGDGCYTNCGDDVIAEANRRGFIVAKFNRTEFASDIYSSFRDNGIYFLYPESHFSAISAWAWGYSRAMDALEQLDFVDSSQVAITGHSRGGKTVLLAGAVDTRFAYTNPNNSGAHGCGCYRFEQVENKNTVEFDDYRSEKLADLVWAVPYWLGPQMKTYVGRETDLPYDMHFFKALIAPRFFIETEGLADIWSNPRGSWQTFMAAREVYRFLGAGDRICAWYREGGHRHALPDFCALFDFMETMMGRKQPDPAFSHNPYPDIEPIFDCRYK